MLFALLLRNSFKEDVDGICIQAFVQFDGIIGLARSRLSQGCGCFMPAKKAPEGCNESRQRRTHRKSRSGCANCRYRRVKVGNSLHLTITAY